MPKNERSLSDKLRASYDGHEFKLRAPHFHGDETVYMDMDELAAFYLFTADCLREKEAVYLRRQGFKLIGGTDGN
jgi:hypothetical protein